MTPDSASKQTTRTKDTRLLNEKDYDKVIFSAPFRRLAHKTQVFPLARHDRVHTRLTHSLEVSRVAMSLTKTVLDFEHRKTREQFGDHCGDQDFIQSIVYICGTAALLHDIGNPPFGHKGEEALRSWWSSFDMTKIPNFPNIKQHPVFNDFNNFEGNAHGLRLFLQKIPELNMNVMAAYVKYPSLNLNIVFPKQPGSTTVAAKKNGIYLDDLFHMSVIAYNTGMEYDKSNSNNVWKRHQLSFLVEHADDLCNSTIDLEDTVHLSLISKEDALKELESLYTQIAGTSFDPENDSISKLRNAILEAFTHSLCERYETDEISTIKFDSYFESLKDFNYKNIYSHPSIVKLEVSGFNALECLMDYYVKGAIATYHEKFNLPKGAYVKYCHAYKLVHENVRNRIAKIVKEVDQVEKATTISMEGEDSLATMCVNMGKNNIGIYDSPVFAYLLFENKKDPNKKDPNNNDPNNNDTNNNDPNNNDPNNNDPKIYYLIYKIVMTISDYVIGMTDRYALQCYQEIQGIKVEY